MNKKNDNKDGGDVKPAKKRRGMVPLIVFSFIVAFVLFLIIQHEPINVISCTPEIIDSKPEVIMLSASWCGTCHHVKRYFQNNNISYCAYDVESSAVGRQLYQKHGAGAVPILLIGEYQLNGFVEQRIEAALELTRNANPENS